MEIFAHAHADPFDQDHAMLIHDMIEAAKVDGPKIDELRISGKRPNNDPLPLPRADGTCFHMTEFDVTVPGVFHVTPDGIAFQVGEKAMLMDAIWCEEFSEVQERLHARNQELQLFAPSEVIGLWVSTAKAAVSKIEQIKELVCKVQTFTSIGAKYGISRQAVKDRLGVKYPNRIPGRPTKEEALWLCANLEKYPPRKPNKN